MRTATFFLSTGRCGTQWITEALRAALGDKAVVEHEPLHNDYAPRRMLGANDPAAVGGRSARRMQEHAARIDEILASRDYIETGHPAWGALPWLLRRFEGRLRIVHLLRHPIPTARSWLSHQAFVPPLLPHLPVKELALPTDAGVAFPEYAAQWSQLTPYEKCLYYWAEVNALGLRLERQAGVPWLRVTYEALFEPGSAELSRLFDFVGAPATAANGVDRTQRVDRHRFVVEVQPEIERITAHPQIVALAEAFGYDVRNG